jgi:hypothetical protein
MDQSPAYYLWTVDTTPPTVTINPAATQLDPTNQLPIRYTVVFSEAVTGFTATDLQVNMGVASITGSGESYTVSITSVPIDGDVTISLPASTVKDLAQNFNIASTGDGTVQYDTTPPNTSITSAPTLLTNSASFDFSYSATEVGSFFERSIDEGAWMTVLSSETVVLADGTHTLRVRARDPAGNIDPTPASHTWTIDTTAPTVTINQVTFQEDPTSAVPISFIAVFSETVTGFFAADIVIGGTAPGSLIAAVSGSGTIYVISVSGMTDSGSVTASDAARRSTLRPLIPSPPPCNP